MNKERILAVAKHIEDGAAFDMSTWFQYETFNTQAKREAMEPECKTPACIAGWAIRCFASKEEKERLLEYDISEPELASQLFDIEPLEEGRHLFTPSGNLIWSYASVKPEHAVSTLRHLAKTGEVDWFSHAR